ncbi:MAG: hypothetical protein IGS03_06150 [Candidatus Sericytochromatia bacterium]|nr:hypothetical protein [Candidatus Sericytochromatia bacterium]
MTRYRPVPRTLSDLMRRLAKRPQNAPELLPPEALAAQRVPMVDPRQLFQGVTIRASQDAQTRQQIAREGFKSPEALFGEQRLATPGQNLASPQALDMLPGQPQPEIQLAPLPSDAEIAEIRQRLQTSKTDEKTHDA